MRVRAQVNSAFIAIAAVTLLAACSGGSSPINPTAANGNPISQTAVPLDNGAVRGLAPFHIPSGLHLNMAHQSSMARDLPSSLVYVSYANSYEVLVYNPKGSVIGNIAPLASPNGIFVDHNHDLWVTQQGWFIDPGIVPQMPTVLEFARGSTRPKKTLLDPGSAPEDVTVCSNGTVYVSSYATLASGYKTGGNIAVYASGRKPTGILKYPGAKYPGAMLNFSVTCDAAGNVFSIYWNFHKSVLTPLVVEYPHGKQAGATLLPIPNAVGHGFRGIKADAAGNLLLADSFAPSVCKYTEAGAATGQCMSLPGNSSTGIAVNDKNLVLDADQTDDQGVSMQFPSGAGTVIYPGPYYSSGVAFDPGL